MKRLLFLLALGIIFHSCQEAAKPKLASASTINMDEARKTIDGINARFGAALVSGDSATIVGLYHSEAQIMPTEMPLMTNRSAMGSMARSMPQMGIKSMELKTAELLNAGDYLVERGNYTMGDGSRSIDKGKYLVLWKEENGTWKLYRDIWNSDNPPPTASK